MNNLCSLFATFMVLPVALGIGRTLWIDYMDSPWTRDGRGRADIINVAADVSGTVVEVPARANQWVTRGDLLMKSDPEHYRIAYKQAQALTASRKATGAMRQLNPRRRPDRDQRAIATTER
ncbi:biotin/lipoyl-binding protein, partial [Pseudomonas syringae]